MLKMNDSCKTVTGILYLFIIGDPNISTEATTATTAMTALKLKDPMKWGEGKKYTKSKDVGAFFCNY